ncbi:MAG: hypothetical protein CM15mP93_12380 [Thiotrichaceae bacterium]|nr:MAG: hypothetical protein CM15mP93_12380 [Thiotrichaceae bacterium]
MEMIKISGMNQGKLHQMQSRGVGDLKILGISQFKKLIFHLGFPFLQVNTMSRITI